MTDTNRFTVLARRTAARTVATAFMPAELGVERAALDGAKCLQVMIEERKKSRLGREVGADELVLVSEAVTKSLEALRCFAQAHKMLIRIPEQNDMDDTFGPACGPNVSTLRAVPGLDRDAA